MGHNLGTKFSLEVVDFFGDFNLPLYLMSIPLIKISKDHWVASYGQGKDKITAEGHSPLSAAHEIIHRLHELNFTVVVPEPKKP